MAAKLAFVCMSAVERVTQIGLAIQVPVRHPGNHLAQNRMQERIYAGLHLAREDC
jgi:hypothetical protein